MAVASTKPPRTVDTPATPSNRLTIVAVADTHLFEYDLIVPDGDIFVHAGDMTKLGELAELKIAARWINSLQHKHKVIIAGNHDWAFVKRPEAARALFDAHYLQDSEVTIEGLRFYGSPWQPEFCNWAFNLPRGAALDAVWSKIPEDLDVLITHGPPQGFGDRVTSTEHVGCANLLYHLARSQPRLHLFGHTHADGGHWVHHRTHLVNVTTAEATRQPSVIEIDRATRRVTIVTSPPRGKRQ